MNQAQIETSKFISEGNVRATETKNTLDFKSLKANIKAIGIHQPLLYKVNEKGEFVVRDGHQRLEIAKQLKLKTVPAVETNGEIDDTTLQISVNMMRVQSSILDGAFAIQQLEKKGIIKTRKQLSSHFGKSVAWVNDAVSLCNMHTDLQEAVHRYIQNVGQLQDMQSEYLLEISKNPIEKQEDVLIEYLECDPDDITHHVLDLTENAYNFTGFLCDIAENIESDESKWKYIKKHIGEDTFREIEANHDVKHTYQSVLFQEYAKDQWCSDENFLQEVFLSNTDIGNWLLEKEIRIDGYWVELQCPIDWSHKLSSLKSKMVKMAKAEGHDKAKFSNIMVDYWNGNVFNPKIAFTVELNLNQEEENDDNATEEFAEAIKGEVVKDDVKVVNPLEKFEGRATTYLSNICEEYVRGKLYSRAAECDENGVNKFVKWSVSEVGASCNIEAPCEYTWDEKDYHPCVNWTETNNDEDNLPLDNNSLVNKMASLWFPKYFHYGNFEKHESLLNIYDEVSFRDYFYDLYDKDEDIRKEWIGMFTIAVLNKEAGLSLKTKSALVEHLSESKVVYCNSLLKTIIG